MARVDSPKFDSTVYYDTVKCGECPLEDLPDACFHWGESHDNPCPTASTYAAACELAEKEAHK